MKVFVAVVVFLLLVTSLLGDAEGLSLPCDHVVDVKQINNSWIEFSFCAKPNFKRFVVISENVGMFASDDTRHTHTTPKLVTRHPGAFMDDVQMSVRYPTEPHGEYRFFVIGYPAAATSSSHDVTRGDQALLFGQLITPACDYTECIRRDSDKRQCLTDEMRCNGVIECRDNEDESFCPGIKARSFENLGPCIAVERTMEDLHMIIPPICSRSGWYHPLQCSHLEEFEMCTCVDGRGREIMEVEMFMLGDEASKHDLLQRCKLERQMILDGLA